MRQRESGEVEVESLKDGEKDGGLGGGIWKRNPKEGVFVKVFMCFDGSLWSFFGRCSGFVALLLGWFNPHSFDLQWVIRNSAKDERDLLKNRMTFFNNLQRLLKKSGITFVF